MATNLPPPPRKDDQRFDNWVFTLWKRTVAALVSGGVGATSPITITTSGTGTVNIGHGASGVATGTYGGSGVSLQVVVNTFGHITAASTFAAAASGKWTPWPYIVAATDTLSIGDGEQMVFAQQVIVNSGGDIVVSGTGQLHVI